jgi:hypothetical protein
MQLDKSFNKSTERFAFAALRSALATLSVLTC